MQNVTISSCFLNSTAYFKSKRDLLFNKRAFSSEKTNTDKCATVCTRNAAEKCIVKKIKCDYDVQHRLQFPTPSLRENRMS